MYSWYTPETVNVESPSYLTILEFERLMRYAPTIYPRSKASELGSLPILATPTTNLEQPHETVEFTVTMPNDVMEGITELFIRRRCFENETDLYDCYAQKRTSVPS
ncbi:hypothetical protein TNCV_4191 [Trichonephila clavipes]|nr:hypothetical protein TNCV_4191 [Trichonephila clavipes]